MLSIGVSGFSSWRDAARVCLAKDVAPSEVTWLETPGDRIGHDFSPSLPTGRAARERPLFAEVVQAFRVPKPFLELARLVSCHRDAGRWQLLYRVLWRLTHGERKLLEFRIDDDIYRLHQMADAVCDDAQRMKSALRFHRLDHLEEDSYIAWFRPEHETLRLVAPFFAQRFKMLHWAIVTPEEGAFWDQRRLQFGPGVPLAQSPSRDQLEQLWHRHCRKFLETGDLPWPTQGAGIAAPHWALSPEARLGEEVFGDGLRGEPMAEPAKRKRRSAEDFLPERPGLAALQHAARHCQGCDLYKNATQTVFGEGPPDAKVMLIGEQPGDAEDITGHPFVGPAGQVLNEALATVGLDRNEVYLTNAVKHFKNTPRGKRRVHAKPTRGEVLACRPWLESEIFTVEPSIIVCLGATAAQSLLGADFRISKQRGEIFETEWATKTIATWHPSSILRIPDATARETRRQELIADLQHVVEQLAHV